MHDTDEPPTRPQSAIPPVYPARGAAGLFADSEPSPARGAADPFADLDWDPYYPAMADAAADEARDLGLRRLSTLTMHATGLSVVTVIGFTTVFASTAHPAANVVAAKPSPGPAAATGTPSPGPAPTAHKKKHRHHHHTSTAPGAASTAPAGSAPAAGPAAGPASAPTLAPPATPPAPAPPSPAPPPTTSSGSVPA
jgi:hypothetical protein